MPLLYIIRVAFVPEDDNDDPAFGDEDLKYTYIDMEMMGPRGATIFCHNSSAPRGASSFGQI